MIICPCCGFRFEGDLRKGCEGCGARSVGNPLPKPDHELPAYVPVTFVVLWGGRRIYRSMLQAPERFVGLKVARRGLLASALVSLLIATLIVITVPARLRQRRMSIEAGLNARAYTLIRAQLEYQARYGAVATEIKDLKDLPDPDGSIAAALADVDPAGYQPRGADL